MNFPVDPELFDLPPDACYLNCASRSPLPKAVYRVGCRALATKLQPWRIGDNSADDTLRSLFATLINAPPSSAVNPSSTIPRESFHISRAPSTSYGISLVAASLKSVLLRRKHERQTILMVHDTMSSNMYAWQNLCKQVPNLSLQIVGSRHGNESSRNHRDLTHALLEADWSKVALVAIPNVRWTDGAYIDLKVIGQKCRWHNVWLIIDATQSLGALPFDVQENQADYVIASVHKWMFGAYGMALSFCSQRFLEIAEPLEHHEQNRMGGKAESLLRSLACQIRSPINLSLPPISSVSRMFGNPVMDFTLFSTADGSTCLPFVDNKGYDENFQPGARKLDHGGRPNPILIPILVESLFTVINKWRISQIQAYILSLIDYMKIQLQSEGFSFPLRHRHICGAYPPADIDSEELVKLMKMKGVYVSARSGCLRIAPHIYNSTNDIDYACEVIKYAIARLRVGREMKEISSIVSKM